MGLCFGSRDRWAENQHAGNVVWRFGLRLVWVESKARDLGDDRGYRVVVDMEWAGFGLNPHPFKTERVRHPNADLDAQVWGDGRARF